jgi:hypothetical protein
MLAGEALHEQTQALKQRPMGLARRQKQQHQVRQESKSMHLDPKLPGHSAEDGEVSQSLFVVSE